MPPTDNGSAEAIFPNWSWLVVESQNKDLEKKIKYWGFSSNTDSKNAHLGVNEEIGCL